MAEKDLAVQVEMDADRMGRVGEYCHFDELAGTVETIGMQSTRIRALDRTLTTISNVDLARRKIINYSRRYQCQIRHKLDLRYETPLSVRLISNDDYAVVIDVYADVMTSGMNDLLAIQEKLPIEIRQIIMTYGSDFASRRRPYTSRGPADFRPKGCKWQQVRRHLAAVAIDSLEMPTHHGYRRKEPCRPSPE